MPDTIKNLGNIIKEIRLRKGFTQEGLSVRSGLTKSYISLMEAGKKIPAISTLSEIAVALGVTIGDFFKDVDQSSNVAITRKGERLPDPQKKTPYGYIYNALSLQKKDRIMDPFIVQVLPSVAGKVNRVEFEHKGEEFDYVLEGRIKYTIEEVEYILEAGDSIYFNSTFKHSVEALDNKPALTLSVHASR